MVLLSDAILCADAGSNIAFSQLDAVNQIRVDNQFYGIIGEVTYDPWSRSKGCLSHLGFELRSGMD